MGAGGKKGLLGSPERLLGRPREMCNSLQPARADAPSEGAGSPKVLPGTAKGGRGDPAQSPEENLGATLGLEGGFEGALSGLLSRIFAPRDGLGG